MPDPAPESTEAPGRAKGRHGGVQSPRPERFRSVDALRGLDILVMLFVNDLAGVAGVPAWMEHVAKETDGMTFVDVVFPAFLLIVGISIPLALGRQFERGDSWRRIWSHVGSRTLALLVIGVFMVNGDGASAEGILSPAAWNLLMYAAVILAWNVVPTGTSQARSLGRAARVAGVLLLIALAFAYRGPGADRLLELETQWWGILGLIGWAYLIACLVYWLARNNVAALIGSAALLYCVYIANAAGAFAGLTWITAWVDIGSMWGSHAAITVSGVVLGTTLAPGSAVTTPAARIRWALVFGAGLAVAGVLLHAAHAVHPMFTYSKILATPPWCLLSSAFTVWIWAGIYWLMDVRGWTGWAAVLEAAGQNALFAYVLAPLVLALFEVLAAAMSSPNYYAELGSPFAVGLCRAAIFALAATWLAGRIARAGVRLRI
jgi:heparan-alpha-glucosaminide N-acetyltransferase